MEKRYSASGRGGGRGAKPPSAKPETMADRIMSLIENYNRSNPRKRGEKMNMERLSRLATGDANKDLIRNLVTRSKSNPDAGVEADKLLKIASFFGVSVAFLRSGAEADVDDFLNKGASPFPVHFQPRQPVISVAGAAASDEQAQIINDVKYPAGAVRGEVQMPGFVLSSMSHHARADRVHWIEVRGDSMEPTLCAGDWVCVNVADRSIDQGGIFALRDSAGRIAVKRVQHSEDPKRVDILSDNDRHSTRRELVGHVEIIGRVFGRLTRVG